MKKLLYKELRLSASPLAYLFLLAGFLTLTPGYPILMSAFFVVFGIFQSFQLNRETNDILYSALLPVSKGDVVRSKYAFAVLIELLGFVLMAILTLLRMTVLRHAPAYESNPLMPANLVFLGFALLLLGCFNALFVGGFFKTAYYYGKPFIAFAVSAFLVVGLGETLHHVPGLEALGALGWEHLPLQLGVLGLGALLYVGLTLLSMGRAVARFEKIDL